MQFHERLKQLRKERGFTQEELAERLHVSRSAVAKWENGLGLPSDDSLKDIAEYFNVTREELLADRETQTIIVEKNGELSRQKKWLIVFIVLATALSIASAAILGAFLNRIRRDELIGGGDVTITGITAYFAVNSDEYKELADHEYVKEGNNYVEVYHLKKGETYKFFAVPTWRGSKMVAFPKLAFKIFYDTELFDFDEGWYYEEESQQTYSYDSPFFFTCGDQAAETEIYVVAYEYFCKVRVIIEN